MAAEPSWDQLKVRAALRHHTAAWLRGKATGMPYRSEAGKEELVAWLATYKPEMAAQEPEVRYCKATPLGAAASGSWASASWKCERQASKKTGDDPDYCWQHQDSSMRA